jgi:hypothetical protein
MFRKLREDEKDRLNAVMFILLGVWLGVMMGYYLFTP